VFHSAPVPLAAHPNIVLATGRPLHETIAMVAACDYFMAVDTAFYHFAAAFDIPALGLFGPTSGATFSLHHARHMLVRPPPAFTCAPCWRNEDMPCYLTGRHESACLASIAPDDIVRAMAELMHRYPVARPTQAKGRQP
jgi:ADP-heptose:LPS heptosyltransferase